jgi:PAS domain S-box-containing protein
VSESPEVLAARLAAIVESSDDAIVSKTLDGIVQSWNQAAERLFGYSAAEIIGRSITLIIPEDRQSEEKDILARVVRGERLDHFETQRRRKDGTLVDISLTVSPVKDAGGRIIAASKIARDVSERKRDREEMARLFILARVEVEERKKAEDRVRELNQELESRVQARTADLEAFSYTIAHDLRAPLRAIHRFSDVLLEDYAERLDEEGRDYLTRLAGGAARMDRLIADLLDYSRVARAQVDPRPVDLAEVLSDVLDHLAAEIQEKKARLIVQNGLHALLADKILLTQILKNLIANALKFVPAGTTPEVKVSARALDPYVRLQVEDNGIGIAPEHHQRIFQLFERLHAMDAYPGTGVGLAIVRKAVERMNGRFGLDSALGRGSLFWVDVPAESR